MALELHDGFPRLLMDYGSGTVQVNHTEIRLTDGGMHHIDITWSNMVSDARRRGGNVRRGWSSDASYRLGYRA